MKKFRKALAGLLISAAAVCGTVSAAPAAFAATIDDVAAVARQYGIPESAIQQGYNEYYADPDVYTSEHFDSAIAYIEAYHQDIINQLTGGSDNPQTPTEAPVQTEPATTETSTETVTKPASSGESSPQAPADESTIPNRVPEKEFINMTLEEKQNYVASLSPEDQTAFLNSLSPDELKSVVKQLPTEEKASVLDNFAKASSSLGVNVTVDEISNDSVSISMRNNKGELVDVASLGVIVEDTGYDYRPVYLIAAAMLLAAAGGIWLVLRRFFINDKKEAENE